MNADQLVLVLLAISILLPWVPKLGPWLFP